MNILVIAATSIEIQPAMDQLKSLPSASISVCITGVGTLASSVRMMQAINQHRPAMMIQAGIAGSFAQGDEGNTYAIESDTVADMGVLENNGFHDIFQLGLSDPNEAPYTGGRLANPYRQLLGLAGTPIASGITVNEVTTTAEKINWYKQNTGARVESMEGAAMHFIGLTENIPFLQLRSVSNYIGERDKTRWKMRSAIENLNNVLLTLIKKCGEYDETFFRIQSMPE